MSVQAVRYARKLKGSFGPFEPLVKSKLPHFRIKFAVRALVLLGVASLLANCSSMQGDFGRPKKSQLLSNVSDNFNLVTSALSDDRSEFPLTVEEMELRNASYHFHRPLPHPVITRRILREIKRILSGQRTALTYADYFTDAGYVSGKARVATLMQELAADHAWFKRFKTAVQKVHDADLRRINILTIDDLAYSDMDRINTHARIKENRHLVKTSLRDISFRMTAYTYAIERSRLETPGSSTQQADTSLNLLREEVSYFKTKHKQWTLVPDEKYLRDNSDNLDDDVVIIEHRRSGSSGEDLSNPYFSGETVGADSPLSNFSFRRRHVPYK